MQLLAWLEERTGWASAWRRFAEHPVPQGPRLAAVLPAVMVYLLLQQIALGVVMAAYYSPSATDAWASTAYLEDQVALGWLVRGLHHHGTSALLLAAGTHLLVLAARGRYRRPRELVFIATLGLCVVTMATGVTGNILPWDEQAYWAAQVELGIMEQSPGGETLRQVVQGGDQAGNLTLTHLYAVHAFVLPLVAVGLVVAIVRWSRRADAREARAASTSASPVGRSQPFVAGQLLLDMVAMTVVAGALVGVTMATHGAALFGPADPGAGFQARPEWYFRFLYELRMAFEGSLEPVATMVIPGAAIAFLVAAPFLDPLRGKLGRWGVRGVLGTMLVGIVGLTAWSVSKDAGNESYVKSMDEAHARATKARGFALEGVLPEGGTAVFRNDPEYKVKQLFVEHCHACHELDGLGGDEAPSLSDYSSRAWLAGLIRNPNGPRFFGGTEHRDMDPYPATGENALPDDQLDAVVEYLWRLQGESDVDETLADHGATLWEEDLDCSSCHEVEAGSDGTGPNLRGHGSAAWVMRVIRDPGQADLFGDEAQMPKFGPDKIDDEQLAALAELIVRQRRPDEPPAD